MNYFKINFVRVATAVVDKRRIMAHWNLELICWFSRISVGHLSFAILLHVQLSAVIIEHTLLLSLFSLLLQKHLTFDFLRPLD